MTVLVCSDPALGAYHFGASHPFGPYRLDAFLEACQRRGLERRFTAYPSRTADADTLQLFHTPEYVSRVRDAEANGEAWLDQGDTPVVPGIFDAASRVVGTTLAGIDRILAGEGRRAFTPIAGLHHARRDRAAGFCVFNDCGVAIEYLRREHGLQRIAYVDIDAHHGDGVFYGFVTDPDVFIVDFHEDGRFLYPGTGAAEETGEGEARGTKRNVPLPMGANDVDFARLWPGALGFLRAARPEFVLLQCGADGLAGDPITHLAFSAHVHAIVTRDLCRLADDFCAGRLLAMGGGGYNPDNIGAAWGTVVATLLEQDAPSASRSRHKHHGGLPAGS